MTLRAIERPPASEADLIAGCVRGDRDSERELFRREYPRVHALLFRVLGSSRELDDIAQETFIAVFRALPRFRGEAKLTTWIDRIAVNVACDHIAARKRQPIPVETIYDRPDPGGAPDDRAQARDGLRRLYGVLNTMSPDARIAFALYAIDGRSIADVAAITRTSIVAAKLRIWRARRQIQRAVAADPVLREYIARHRGDR